jgi:hypothetical protein
MDTENSDKHLRVFNKNIYLGAPFCIKSNRMRIVHIAREVKEKPKTPSKSQLERESARRRLAIQEETNFRKALIEHADLIAEVQKLDPTWKPIKVKTGRSSHHPVQ